MCNISLQGWKGNTIYEFKIVNAKNITIEFKKLLKYGTSIHWDFNHVKGM